MTQLLPLMNIPGYFPSGGFHGCILNELASLAGRHIIQIPETTDQMMRGFRAMRRCLSIIFPAWEMEKMSQQAIIDSTNASKRECVRKAFTNINRTGYLAKYHQVSAFIKWEKHADLVSDPLEGKTPRLIQHREPEYCYTLARYLKPIEHYVFNTKYGRRVSDPYFSKGMTSWQVGERIAKMDRWADTVFVLLDHSRYDSTLRAELRRTVEYPFYQSFYPNNKELADLLRKQVKNRGTTRSGVRYTVIGTMMSGEYNTSLGDSVINYALIRNWVHGACDILVNGDDSVVSMPYRVYKNLDFDYFKQMGFRTKVEVVYSLNEVNFCQCQPVRIEGKWRMIRTPTRVISRIAYTCKSLRGDGWSKLAWAIGAGELACNDGVPILQQLGLSLVRDNIKSTRMLNQYMQENRRHDKITMKAKPISMETRMQFQLTFGYTIAEQIGIERAIRQHSWRALPV